MIRSLDIGPRERSDPLLAASKPKVIAPPATWLLDVPPKRRLSLHIAMTTLARPKPRRGWWRYVALAYLAPSGFALAVIAALAILRRGI
jgi:hypothetical protein